MLVDTDRVASVYNVRFTDCGVLYVGLCILYERPTLLSLSDSCKAKRRLIGSDSVSHALYMYENEPEQF